MIGDAMTQPHNTVPVAASFSDCPGQLIKFTRTDVNLKDKANGKACSRGRVVF